MWFKYEIENDENSMGVEVSSSMCVKPFLLFNFLYGISFLYVSSKNFKGFYYFNNIIRLEFNIRGI